MIFSKQNAIITENATFPKYFETKIKAYLPILMENYGKQICFM